MGIRDSLSNSIPNSRDTNRLILHDGNQAIYQQNVDPRQFQTTGDDRYRHQSLHNFHTEYDGHQNRKIGQSQVTEAKPVSFYRELEPNKYLNAPELEGAREVQVIEKQTERLVEVVQLHPLEKVVDRLFESIQIQDQTAQTELQLTCIVPEIIEIQKPVHYDREILKEQIQEIYVDKVVERVVEVLREVYIDKIVQRRVEIIKEVPTIRYVDRVITREVPIVQVVERVVEVLKEVPIEVVKEVPVYVRTDVTDVEEHNRNKGHYTQAGPSFSQYTGGTQSMVLQQQQSSYTQQGGGFQTSGGGGVSSQQTNGGMASSSSYQQNSSASASGNAGGGRAGVGLVLEREQSGTTASIFVRKLVPGSPAFSNGQINVNDKLVSIDGTQMGNMHLDKVFELINGPAGSTLNMTLERNSANYDVTLTRGQAKK
mmetsp:Transcript_72704/g.106586  ORF Transcript_72704/g.106586 Transcript_72704/m.106586 type:complete len:427 (-) Transcript_72704:735-2015(-)